MKVEWNFRGARGRWYQRQKLPNACLLEFTEYLGLSAGTCARDHVSSPDGEASITFYNNLSTARTGDKSGMTRPEHAVAAHISIADAHGCEIVILAYIENNKIHFDKFQARLCGSAYGESYGKLHELAPTADTQPVADALRSFVLGLGKKARPAPARLPRPPMTILGLIALKTGESDVGHFIKVIETKLSHAMPTLRLSTS